MFGLFETVLCLISGAAAFLFFWRRQKSRDSDYAVSVVRNDGREVMWREDDY